MRTVAPFGSLYVLQARVINMRKFVTEIAFYSIANPFLYLMAIGVGVGSMVNQHSGGVDGVKYLVFLAPALLANAAVQGSMDEVIFPTLAGFNWNKGFYAMNSTPLNARQITLGVYFASMVRNFITVITYFLIMMAFGVLKDPKAWLIIPTALLAGAAFAAILIGIAGNAKSEDNFFTFFGRFVLQPMFFLSGTFFPLDSLPIYLRWVGWISPLWHATDLGRYLSYGRSLPGWLIFTHIAILLAMIVIGLSYGFRVFERKLAK